MKKALLSVLITVFLASFMISYSGCGDGRPGFEEVISNAVEAAAEVNTYRMEIENDRVEQGESDGMCGWMEFVAPDRVHTISYLLPDDSRGAEVIQVGANVYMRDIGEDWSKTDWGNSISADRNLAGILDMFTGLEDIEELGDEEINGVDCYHYIGKNKVSEQVKEQFPSFEYSRYDTEFWIGKDDCLLRQYKVVMEIAEDEDSEEIEHWSSIATCTFSKFNEPIKIEAPMVGEPVVEESKDEE